MSAPTTARPVSTLARIRGQRAVRAARRFRRTRPFWAAVLVGLGGLEIGYLPLGPVNVLIKAGPGAVYGLGCSLVLLVMAAVLLLAPSQRVTAGIVAVLVGLASFILSNLGGFVVGMLLAVVGGSLAIGWVPDKTRYAKARRPTVRTTPVDQTPAPRPSPTHDPVRANHLGPTGEGDTTR